jgi:hypothetical protein
MTTNYWTPVADHLSDADTTVMIFDPTANDSVWLGYFDGGTWRNSDGWPASPTHWMDIPEGPKP